jgi:hypothetical protein
VLGGRAMTGALRAALEKAMTEHGCPMKDLTVLDKQTDPFRVDTPAGHRDGEWLASTAARLGLGNRKIHLRGLHYMVIGEPKPDGTPYANTAKDWEWLQSDAAKAARFLGYIPFDQITDQRNAQPEVRRFEYPAPFGYLSTGITVKIPETVRPELHASDFRGVQPYKLVMVGEKSSLEPVLSPVAAAFEADVYLPTGEMSDTLIYQMARVALDDCRPMAVLYFSDCDPAGWQMPISVARKLQAFAELLGRFEFAVYRVALTPDQVREHDLPSTPLKDTEQRGGRWQAAMGVEQTEIDALAALRPELLTRIASEATGQFYDASLGARVRRYRDEWLDRANDMIEATLDTARLAEIRREAEQRLSQMREQIRQLNDAMRIDVDDDDLPPIDIPDAELTEEGGLPPLVSSDWDFADQCRALIASKQYGSQA